MEQHVGVVDWYIYGNIHTTNTNIFFYANEDSVVIFSEATIDEFSL